MFYGSDDFKRFKTSYCTGTTVVKRFLLQLLTLLVRRGNAKYDRNIRLGEIQ